MTRLALEIAAALEEDFADGVVWGALAPVRDPNAVGNAIAASIGITGAAIGDRLVRALRGSRLLLILDYEEPGARLPTIAAPPAPPTPVRFLATDIALANGLRMPAVRDAEGRVGWVAVGTRLLPRVEEQS